MEQTKFTKDEIIILDNLCDGAIKAGGKRVLPVIMPIFSKLEIMAKDLVEDNRVNELDENSKVINLTNKM